ALTRVALHVEPILELVGRQGLAALSHDLHVVWRADPGGSDAERDARGRRRWPHERLVGVGRGARGSGEGGSDKQASHLSHVTMRRPTRVADLKACIVRAMAPLKKAVKASKSVKSKPKPTAVRASKQPRGKPAPDIAHADATLFDPLTPGEIAD